MAEKTFVVGDARVGSNQLGWVELFFPQFWFNLSYCHWEKNKNNKRKAVPLCYSLLYVFGFNSCFSLFYPWFSGSRIKLLTKLLANKRLEELLLRRAIENLHLQRLLRNMRQCCGSTMSSSTESCTALHLSWPSVTSWKSVKRSPIAMYMGIPLW